ncbi:MAG: hypothetical protein IJ565_06545 [Bacilli bacterium]|nr:hypothetical protein [Bacilli bacterium]
MIDIHSHIIFDVDDGSKTLEQSIKYLEEIKKVGIKKVVCTPHIKNQNDEKLRKIDINYKILKEEANKRGIELYLGNEIMYSEKIITLLNNENIHTLNNTKYILVEFKRNENMDEESIITIFEKIIDAGYNPILAHPELYRHYRHIDFVEKLRAIGVIIQIDATSVLASSPFNIYIYTHKLLKNCLVDIVASDSHCTRKRNFKSLSKAYKKLKRKYGDYADIMFKENPEAVTKKSV